jgi:hypothetical protein
MLIFAAAVFTREIAVAAACVGLVVLLLPGEGTASFDELPSAGLVTSR